MTKAEVCLWKYALKESQMIGYVFRRQRPILHYITDFMCKELLLLIEVDGATHFEGDVLKKDERRQWDLENAGYTVLRFWDDDVLKNIEGVKQIITNWIVAEETTKGIKPFKEQQLPPG